MDSLLVVGIAFLLFIGLSKGSTVASLNFIATGVSFDFSNVLTPVVGISLLVQNPTSGSLSLLSIAGGFTVNGNPSGNVSFFPGSPVLIAPNSQTQIVINLIMNDASLINSLIDLVQSKGNILIGVNATANVGGIPVPLNFSITP